MRFKKRYRFWQVLVGIIVMGMVFYILYTLTNDSDGKEVTQQTSSSKQQENGARMFAMFIYIVVFFYFALNYYYYAIASTRRYINFLKVTAAIIVVNFIYHLFLYQYLPKLLHGKYSSVGALFSGMITEMIPMVIVCFLFAYGTYLYESQKQRRILEAQKLQLEIQVSQANFNFLKAQINPHFLHNTLNFLYAKSIPYSAELSEGILTLSDIMRYALDQGNQRNGKAPLKDEIEHVHNVIKISQLRFSNQLNVRFDVSGSVEGATIIPFVLITIVENAFKHGDLKNPDHPIDIRLRVDKKKLYFYCWNKKKASGTKQLSTGIGLENIRTRLEMAYGDKHTFKVKDEPAFYTTELTIEQL
jgi:two-component system, LytTR family, sensor kinase